MVAGLLLFLENYLLNILAAPPPQDVKLIIIVILIKIIAIVTAQKKSPNFESEIITNL